MKITAISRNGVIGVDADTRAGTLELLHAVDVAFEDGAFVRVPPGFVFDGASIPPRARSIIQSLTTAGSVLFALHDYGYRRGAHWTTPLGLVVPISRQRADWMALALCTWLDLACDDSLQIYSALRVGGEASYRQRDVL